MHKTLWVVMELCELGSALDMMRNQRAPLREGSITWICAGVLKALHYMHSERKAIHRDIKAANILLTRDGGVKVADLGVATQLFNTMSKRGTMIGKTYLVMHGYCALCLLALEEYGDTPTSACGL